MSSTWNKNRGAAEQYSPDMWVSSLWFHSEHVWFPHLILTEQNNRVLTKDFKIPFLIIHSFDALVLRFEAPDSRNRWDSPLFTILKDDSLPHEAVSDALFKRKAPPPNQSTQSVRGAVHIIHMWRWHLLIVRWFSLCSSRCHLSTFCTNWTRSHKMFWWYVSYIFSFIKSHTHPPYMNHEK